MAAPKIDFRSLLGWIINLGIIPSGWLTKLGGWVAIITALACLIGHPILGVACNSTPAAPAYPSPFASDVAPTAAPSGPNFPAMALLTTGLIGVGLGRRSSNAPSSPTVTT